MGLILAAVAGTLLWVIGWGAHYAFTPLRAGDHNPIVIEVVRGKSPNDISRTLSGMGAIENPRAFLWLGKLTRSWKHIKAGEYEVSADLAPIEIFKMLDSGISMVHPITVREGENMYEIASDLDAKGLSSREKFLGLCRSRIGLSL